MPDLPSMISNNAEIQTHFLLLNPLIMQMERGALWPLVVFIDRGRALSTVWKNPRAWRTGPNPGKWTRGFNHDAIVSVANPAASKAFGER